MVFHYFDQFLAEYESHFEKNYGFFRPIIKEVVDRYLDCGNPRCGFARIRCPDCGEERLLMFSCRTRGFCPSCHSKRLEEWGEWMREELISEAMVDRIINHLKLTFVADRPPLRAHLQLFCNQFDILSRHVLFSMTMG